MAATLVFMIGGLIAFSNARKLFGSLVYRTAALTMGIALYFLLTAILLDLFNLVWSIAPPTRGFLALGISSIMVIIGFLNSYRITTTSHTVPVPSLETEIRIAHLSDIHLGHFRGPRFLQQILDRVKNEEPDLIVITGDLFDGTFHLNDQIFKPFSELSIPVYFVNGNHDVYTGLKKIITLLKDTGVTVLQNSLVETMGIQLIGLNHMRPDQNTDNMSVGTGSNMKEVLQGLEIENHKPAVLLHHSPEGIEYANEFGVNLYLSGHTHGGQQFPVTLINDQLFTFNRGLYTHKKTQIIVSQGLGTFGPPLRIGTKSELILVTLQ